MEETASSIATLSNQLEVLAPCPGQGKGRTAPTSSSMQPLTRPCHVVEGLQRESYIYDQFSSLFMWLGQTWLHNAANVLDPAKDRRSASQRRTQGFGAISLMSRRTLTPAQAVSSVYSKRCGSVVWRESLVERPCPQAKVRKPNPA